MDDQRKRTIIAEIENWRRNHLLPEHYCIFLLNLYTEGDRPSTPASAGRGEGKRADALASGAGVATGNSSPSASYAYATRTVAPVTGKMVMAWLLGAFVIAGLILLAFHFNRFTTPMQITIFACFALVFYILGYAFRRQAPPLTHLFLTFCFVLLIAGGIYCIQQLNGSMALTLLYLGVICVLLCLSAFIFGYAYLLYCGMLGLALIYGFATVQRIGEGYTWWKSELYWVPLACLLTGLGFLMNSGNPKWAGVFAVCGLISFFGAEIQALYISEAKRDVIQLLLFIKVFLASALFFFTRGYWYTWLRL
ncbi:MULTISPECIES: hypothetical protein [Brevibacillus]|uniref:hypothetical protein n=1 Tax=Brevibacillus TaxID=55080 RepID=UPI000ECAF7C2|nr:MULTISPECIES: hypothetical protein [Brevibacillus]MED2253050.1 hypothetical protein [Brevibacillus parabrevis]HBZ78869.1 hypothetical protein [Brevibacillus sp.]